MISNTLAIFHFPYSAIHLHLIIKIFLFLITLLLLSRLNILFDRAIAKMQYDLVNPLKYHVKIYSGKIANNAKYNVIFPIKLA